jgi:ABC-type Zn2+ transport system substrate-binding protein/surface adhesin
MSHHDGHDHSGHDHGHADHGHSHDHGHDHSNETEPALQTLMWKQIDFANIRTLNESEHDAGAKIVKKTYQQRMNADPELVSDSDEQLLMFVPYVLEIHRERTCCIDLYTASPAS